MADFQLQGDLIDKIKSYFSQAHENEPCGALVIQRGRLNFFPIANFSTEKDTFSFDPVQYTKLIRYTYMIVHAHDDNCIPSEHDILQCDLHNKPYLIFNLLNFDYTVLWPKNYTKLCGKTYQFGVNDCFEAAHKWYLVHDVVMPTRRHQWKDDWWINGEDYIAKELADWPFKPVQDLKYGDLLVFSMDSAGTPNHLGVYVDNDDFFHHAANRLSCIENLNPIWGKHIIGIYRYENSSIRGLPRGQIW